MLNRRRLLGAPVTAAASLAVLPAAAQTPAPTLAVPDDWGFIGPDTPVSPTVSETRRGREIARSVDLLRNIPAKADALGVARYFEGVNLYNDDCLSYTQEWQTKDPEMGNPIVIMFHTITNTMPNPSDTVHWCAAFVSFCLYAGRMKSLWTCWALDYRNYDGLDTTSDPAVGDIVVFRNRTEGGGHVGFFVGWDRDPSGEITGVRCLGGNQSNRIRTTTFALKGALKLVAIRRPVKAAPIIEKKVCANGRG